MEMEHPARGRYRVENHVVRYESDRALAWAPAAVGAKPSGHVWGWELEPAGDDQTVVTHYHDWADVTDPELLDRIREVTPEEMRTTIANLGAALA